jgi:S-adenosylmethionine/arginine decarboxylase-like enzyme
MLTQEKNLITADSCSVTEGKEMKKKSYGMELIIELFGCDLSKMTSRKIIQEFIEKICQEIKMERYGASRIKRFPGGELWGEGYSFLQFLTTSSIAGHFIERSDRGPIAFINIFSCKEYNAETAEKFTADFFQAKKVKSKLIVH